MEDRRNRGRLVGSVPIRGAPPANPPGPIPAGIRADLPWFARVEALCAACFGLIDRSIQDLSSRPDFLCTFVTFGS